MEWIERIFTLLGGGAGFAAVTAFILKALESKRTAKLAVDKQAAEIEAKRTQDKLATAKQEVEQKATEREIWLAEIQKTTNTIRNLRDQERAEHKEEKRLLTEAHMNEKAQLKKEYEENLDALHADINTTRNALALCVEERARLKERVESLERKRRPSE